MGGGLSILGQDNSGLDTRNKWFGGGSEIGEMIMEKNRLTK